MTEPTVIGLVGEPGSGKGTAVKIIKEMLGDDVQVCSSSDICRSTLDTWGIPPTRENFKKVVIALLGAFGKDALSKAVAKRISGQSARVVLFDGVRMESDRKLVRSFPENSLIYITASKENRFKRMRARGEKAGEANMTFEEFLAGDSGETADVKIENDGSVDELRSHLVGFFKRIGVQA